MTPLVHTGRWTADSSCLLDDESNNAKAPFLEKESPDEGGRAHAKGPNGEGQIEGHLLFSAPVSVVISHVLYGTERDGYNGKKVKSSTGCSVIVCTRKRVGDSPLVPDFLSYTDE